MTESRQISPERKLFLSPELSVSPDWPASEMDIKKTQEEYHAEYEFIKRLFDEGKIENEDVNILMGMIDFRKRLRFYLDSAERMATSGIGSKKGRTAARETRRIIAHHMELWIDWPMRIGVGIAQEYVKKHVQSYKTIPEELPEDLIERLTIPSAGIPVYYAAVERAKYLMNLASEHIPLTNDQKPQQ